MKKFVLFFLAIGLLIPLFAVPTSAASYDLGTPKRLHYTDGFLSDPPNWKFSSIYAYDYDSETLTSRGYRVMNGRVFSFYADRYTGTAQNDGVFELGTPFVESSTSGTVDFSGRYVLVTGFNVSQPLWCFQTNDDVRSSLYFDSFVYENLFIPLEGQYFRVSFTYDAVLTNVPQPVLDFIDINTLCFICDTSGRAGYNDKYSLPKVYPSTTAVTKTEKNTYKYDFFFSLTDSAFSSIEGSMCLGIRIPFYFNTVASYENGIKLFTNAELPSTYEIITIGGYDQALSDIQSSVNNLTNNLVDIYTDQSYDDLLYIATQDGYNSLIDNKIDGYDDALKPLDSLVNDYTAPSAAQQVQQQLSSMATDKVKSFFSVPWIVSALGLVFTFSVIRLILYGTKEG